MIYRNIVLAIVVLAAVCSAARAAVPSPLHDFEFNGSIVDSLSATAITSEGGTIGTSTYRFQPTAPASGDVLSHDDVINQGLTLQSPGLTNPGVYSIEMRVQLDSLRNITPDSQPWVKLIDFKNQQFDDGFYTEDVDGFHGQGLSSYLEYFGSAFVSSDGGVITPGAWSDIVLTRDAAGQVAAYVQGQLVFSADDSGQDLVFNAANNVMRFLQDDLVSPHYGPPGGDVFETTTGQIDFLRIFNGAISATDAAALYQAIPVGELSGDGFVGQDDLNVILGHWGQSVVPGSLADLNHDGFVGQDDLNDVLANWGKSYLSPFGAVATRPLGVVPEPSSLALLGLGSLAISGAWLRRARKGGRI